MRDIGNYITASTSSAAGWRPGRGELDGFTRLIGLQRPGSHERPQLPSEQLWTRSGPGEHTLVENAGRRSRAKRGKASNRGPR